MHYQSRTRTALWVLYVFAGLAGLCFIAYGELAGLGSDDLSVLGVHGSQYRGISRCQPRRLAASLAGLPRVGGGAARSVLLGDCRCRSSSVSRFGHDAFLKRQELELGWIRNMLRVAGQRDDATEEVPSELGVEIAVRDWVGETAELLPTNLATAARMAPLYRNVGSHIVRRRSAAGRMARTRAALFRTATHQWVDRTDGLSAGRGLAAPALCAANRGRRADQSVSVHGARSFERAATAARRPTDASERRRILRELGDAALRENSQWILRLRERPISTVG